MMEIEHFENQEHEWDSKLKVAEGVDQPVQVNPQAMERMMRNRQQLMPLDWYMEGILKGLFSSFTRIWLSRLLKAWILEL